MVADGAVALPLIASMNLGFRLLQDVHPQVIYKFGRDMMAAAPDADGLYKPCHQWQVQEVVEALEHDTGKPVIAGDPADWWQAFFALGIRDRIEGCGRLLRSLSEDEPGGVRPHGILRQAS